MEKWQEALADIGCECDESDQGCSGECPASKLEAEIAKLRAELKERVALIERLASNDCCERHKALHVARGWLEFRNAARGEGEE